RRRRIRSLRSGVMLSRLSVIKLGKSLAYASLECGGLAPLWSRSQATITKRRQAAALQGSARMLHPHEYLVQRFWPAPQRLATSDICSSVLLPHQCVGLRHQSPLSIDIAMGNPALALRL